MIHQVVQELTLLGFSPELVRNVVKQGNDVFHSMREKHNPGNYTAVVIQSHAATGFKLLYEVGSDLGHLVPRLRLIIDKDIDMDTAVSESMSASD